ncbi:MAG TPA: hypothetical protein VNW46_17305 [Gemmatimonadaceae bacterium]|nr:hypothetical protein [Gemmatimonadaceae bacterium]
MASAKKLASAKKRSSHAGERRVAASGAPMSPYAVTALKIFRKGVQAEFKRLAKRGVATVATVDGKPVRAVPRKVAGRYVLVVPAKGAYDRHGRSLSRSARH